MLNLDPGMIIWTWVTFFVVFFILYKVALKPMLKAITDREEGIRSDLDNAARQREEAESLLVQHREMMEKAESEGQKIIRENQQLAEKTKQEIIENARGEADKVIRQAKAEIERQKESALSDLRAEVADLAVNAAEKIIIQELDKDSHKKIVDEYLKSMPESFNN